ncbi:MAG: protein kinase [Planctomycetota bacterium]
MSTQRPSRPDEASPSTNAQTQDTQAAIAKVWAGHTSDTQNPSETIRAAHHSEVAMPAVVVPPSLRMYPRQRSHQIAARGKPLDAGVDFVLGAEVGRGGMGVVRRARQNALGRMVAVKMLNPDHADSPDTRAKFFAEAAVTAELDHPGIVPVYDLGVNTEGVPFYAMKLIKGTPWSGLMDQKTQMENVDILLRVGDAVAYAHNKGVIHRDLKPANVMIGSFGEVQVVDWGVAAAIRPGNHAHPLNESNLIAGTPAYMAPEMATGRIEQLGVWTDVYLLGGILYRIISGHPPHCAKDQSSTLVAAALNEIPTCPNGGELEVIARRALATDPTARFASVREFQQAIRDFMEHHESIALGRSAGDALERAQESGRYPDFALAQSSFRDAVQLWPDNAVARVGLAATELAYAERAFANDDFDLAESLLEDKPDQHRALLDRIRAGRFERLNRQRRSQRLRRSAFILAACLVLSLIGGAAFGWWKEHQRAYEQQRATQAELETQRVATANAAKNERRAHAFVPYSEAVDLLLRGHEFSEASDLLRSAIAIDSTFAEAYFALGESLRLAGLPHLAHPAYLKAYELGRLETKRPNIRALLLAGFAAGDSGEYNLVIRLFQMIKELGTDDPLAAVCEALLLADRSHFAEALAAAEAAAKQAPKLWETHYAIGCICAGWSLEGCAEPRQVIEKGLAALRTAVSLSPGQPNPRIMLSRLLRNSNLPEHIAELRETFTHPDQHIADHMVMFTERIVGALMVGDVVEAEAQLVHVEERSGPPAVILACRAAIAGMKRENETAYDLFAQFVKEYGPWSLVVDKMIRVGVRAGSRRANAVAFFKQWEPEHRDMPMRDAMAAYIAMVTNDFATAQREIDAGLKRAPHNWTMHVVQVHLFRRAKQWQQALDTARAALQLRPRDIEVRVYELEALVRLTRFSEATERADAFEKDFPARAGEIASFRLLMSAGSMFGK